MSETINAAIVGLGRWGELLVSSVDDSDIIQFTAAVTRTPAKAKAFCAERNMKLSDQLDNVLNDDSIGALVIATPHSQHFDQLMAAAKAGKHVYCEKPWTLDAVDGQTALNAFAEAGLKVAIGHNRRFAPNSMAMKEVLNSGILGLPIHVDGHFNSNLAPAEGLWRDDRAESPAGGMTSLGIHAIDMYVNLFGRIESVLAVSRRITMPYDIDDSTTILMDFENGQSGYLGSVAATGTLWQVRAFGNKGWGSIFAHDQFTAQLTDGTVIADSWDGYSYPGMPTIKAQMVSFATDCEGGAPFPAGTQRMTVSAPTPAPLPLPPPMLGLAK